MQIRTDDDVYRVDAVWLGPPRATFPWRARYSSYGVGLIVMILVMFAQRRLGIPLGFFSVAWALLITVVVVRFVGRRIDEDRPLLEWLTLFWLELRGPRRRTRGAGATVDAGHVRIESHPPPRVLPAVRPDPHAALAVSDDDARPVRGAGRAGGDARRRRDGPPAPDRARRSRAARRRPWTTRQEGRPDDRAGPSPAGRADGGGLLRVRALRADRPASSGEAVPRPARTRPASAPRRYGPNAGRAPEGTAADRDRGPDAGGEDPGGAPRT